jgi:transposase InsO family protein
MFGEHQAIGLGSTRVELVLSSPAPHSFHRDIECSRNACAWIVNGLGPVTAHISDQGVNFQEQYQVMQEEVDLILPWYNQHRLHQALAGATPFELRRYAGIPPARDGPRFESRVRYPLNAKP